MTDKEREELIDRMALTMFAYVEDQSRLRFRDLARAALAVAEPVIREQTESALREENARLREALKPFVPETQWIDPDIPDTRPIDVMVLAGELRAARAAIL